MKLYQKYLEELYHSVNRLQEEMKSEKKSTSKRSPVKFIVKPTNNCEITLLTTPNDASTNKINDDKDDQQLSKAQKKCREICEMMEMLSKFAAKKQLTN